MHILLLFMIAFTLLFCQQGHRNILFARSFKPKRSKNPLMKHAKRHSPDLRYYHSDCNRPYHPCHWIFSTVSICPGSSVKREWASISCSVRHYPYLFSLTAAGYQTAISKYVAADSAKRPFREFKAAAGRDQYHLTPVSCNKCHFVFSLRILSDFFY